MTLVLDAGALVAVERAKREVVALIKHELMAGRSPVTHAGIIGQVWRGGAGRGARVAQLLRGLDVRPLDSALGRRAGLLLGKARLADVIDAALALFAADGDTILTSDPGDIAPLVRAAGAHVDVVSV